MNALRATLPTLARWILLLGLTGCSGDAHAQSQSKRYGAAGGAASSVSATPIPFNLNVPLLSTGATPSAQASLKYYNAGKVWQWWWFTDQHSTEVDFFDPSNGTTPQGGLWFGNQGTSIWGPTGPSGNFGADIDFNNNGDLTLNVDTGRQVVINSGATPKWYITSSDIIFPDGTHQATAASGGGGATAFWFDPITIAAAGGWASMLTKGGNFTTGVMIRFTVATHVTGVRFYWPGSSAKTCREKLWDVDTSTQLNSVDIACSTAGIYTATFASSSALTGSSAYHRLLVTVYETSGANFMSAVYPSPEQNRWPGDNNNDLTKPTMIGPSVMVFGWSNYAGGDGMPTTTTTSDEYPILPVFTVP